MKDGHPLAETGPEAGQRLRGEPDLGDEHDDPAAAGDRLLRRRQVDLRLAGAGDPVQQELAALAVERADHPLDRRRLGRIEPGRAGRSNRDLDRAARDLDLPRLDQPALLEAPDRRALHSGALAQLERAGLSPALGEQGDGGRLLASELRPLAGGERPATLGEAHPQLHLRRRRASGRAGPRWQDELQPARRGRAVLASDPQSQLDQLRPDRRADLPDRLRQALGRERRSRTPSRSPPRAAAGLRRGSRERFRPRFRRGCQARLRRAARVVERPTQRSRCRQRLDLGDRQGGSSRHQYAAARGAEAWAWRASHLRGAPLVALDPGLLREGPPG